MTNPYNITEVDIPGVLGAYQNAQDRRLQQMLATRQIAQADRAAAREEKVASAWEKFYQRRDAAGNAQGGAAGAAAAYPASTGAQGAQQPAQPPEQAQQPEQRPYDPWADPAAQQELFSSLVAVNPQEATQVMQAFSQHSKAQREETAAHYATLANAALALRQLPPEQRPAEFQRITPMLRDLGLDDAMLAQADLTDQGLEFFVNQARDLEKVIGGYTPTAVPVSGIGLVPMTPGSPFPDFTNGGARPEAQVGPVGEGTVIENDAGEQMILRNGQWVPVGGGAGNGAGGFPVP